ncbi:MAG TPA: NAD-dependent epimerase/dehydratase family protein [Candidatus Paceibacterota bacterium]|nr:NAD-dependent epimerase/dehydratase family protein [Candidatus Paceibacterota bacterium]
MIQTKTDNCIYAPSTPLRKVLRDVYRNRAPIALVCDRKKVLLGVVTISDIKRALMNGHDPNAPIRLVMNTKFVSAPRTTSVQRLAELARSKNHFGTGNIGKVPLLDASGRVTGVYLSKEHASKSEMTVLVTGGAGYLGSHLCRLLLKRGYRVVVLDKLLFGDESLKKLASHPNFTLINGDIADIGTLVQVVPGADAVIHLAGIVGDPASSLNPLQTMEENHFATKTLVDVCKYYQVSRFIFASSCSVYGASKDMLNEQSPLNPVSLYAQSKRYSERDLLRAAADDFHPTILRFGTLYGASARMRFDLVVNTMTAHAHFNKKIMVDGGNQWRPLLHVTDAARACLMAMEAPLHKVSGQIFNVGDSTENYRIIDIAQAVLKAVPQSTLDARDTLKDRRDYRVSFAKIRKAIGFKTRYTLEKGIRELLSEIKAGKFDRWKEKRYNNYLSLKSALEILS